MDNFNYYFWWLVCFISLKGIKAAKIYVIDVPIADDTKTDDYSFSYVNAINKHKYKNVIGKLEKNRNASIVMCQRLFRIYGNKYQHSRCLEALNKSREKPHDFDRKEKLYTHKSYSKDYQNHDMDFIGRQRYKPYLDLTRFSQDYLDVNDLGRSNIASDYVEINDFRNVRSVIPQCKVEFDEFGQIANKNCFPASRKTLDIEDKGNFRSKVSSEEATELDKILRKKKTKRYKVVSNENASPSDSSEDNGKSAEENFNSGSSIQNSDSIEVTTKKPKKKKKAKNSNTNSYMYMQGNKMYDQEDFRRSQLQYFRNGNENIRKGNKQFQPRSRRGLRMSHFLPKRHHWDEDEYQNLGYYWFNGPRGKYTK